MIGAGAKAVEFFALHGSPDSNKGRGNRMMMFTDGKIQVYCVFHGDGHECCDFVGAFETEEQANEAADKVRANAKAFYESLSLFGAHGVPWHGYVNVEPRILGDYQLPEPEIEQKTA